MRSEEKQLRQDLTAFIEKMQKHGIDIKTIKKPTDVGASNRM
ncbi:hypothetical protein ACFQ38_16400 [Sporosarcina contaminans]|uniref:Uncharacterized protein n=1 Tax=Sporosarcina contaminans TaxID=633403 RepID=A0ABW3U364_9BACL